MIYYVYFIWSESGEWSYGTLVITTAPETLGKRISVNKANNKVSRLYQLDKHKLRICLLDVFTNKHSSSAIRKSLTVALDRKGFIMSQKTRLDIPIGTELDDVDVREFGMTIAELTEDYKAKLPDYVEMRLNRLG